MVQAQALHIEDGAMLDRGAKLKSSDLKMKASKRAMAAPAKPSSGGGMLSKLFGGWGGGSAAKSSAPPQAEKSAPSKKRGSSPQEMMMDMCEARSPSPDRNVMMSLKSGA